MKIARVCGHSFAPELIGAGELVFDCGANQGEFSRWCSQHLDCRIVSFEPDPRLYGKLQPMRGVEFIDRAVSASEGAFALALGVKSCSSGAIKEGRPQQTISVSGVTLDGFCAQRNLHGMIGLIKVDIEGSELDVLERLPTQFLSRTRQITVEFHDLLRASDLPRIRAVAKRVQACGFHLVRFTHYTWGDCLFINKSLAELGPWTRLELLYDKYCAGVVRHFTGRRAMARRPG